MAASRRSRACLALTLAALLLPSCGGNGNSAAASAALSVVCSVSPGAGTVPLLVSYVATIQSSTPPNTVRVDFGDGQSELGTHGTHVYPFAGGYTLRVTAELNGQSASCSQSVSAQPAPPEINSGPVLRLKTSDTIGLAPFDVSFNTCMSADPDGDRLLHSYDFGDGHRTGLVDGCSRTHTYARGTYVALVCVTDGRAGHDVCGAVDVIAQ